ncbi:MAG: DUF4293 domain-containing protein [Bacteroidales bacterium]|nr:DUF4293 domain-containing protein [Bacteroidales bacterium]
MIQRKQTIFLVLSLLAFVMLLVSPFASFNLGTEITCNVSIRGIQGGCDFPGLMFFIMQGLATLFITFTGITIFMYKNRPLQLKLCAFAFLANVFLVGMMFLTATRISNFFGLSENQMDYMFATYIPIITLLVMWLTVRSIRKDEALARSLDRLR